MWGARATLPREEQVGERAARLMTATVTGHVLTSLKCEICVPTEPMVGREDSHANIPSSRGWRAEQPHQRGKLCLTGHRCPVKDEQPLTTKGISMEELRGLAGLIPLLDTALRSRPASPGTLAQQLGESEASVRESLRRLERLGFVSITNDVITYRRPEAAAAGLTERVLSDVQLHVGTALADAQGALGAVPGLVQAWAEGTSAAPNLQVDVAHGPWAPADMWRLQFTRRVPVITDVCMPDTSALFSPQSEYQASFWAARAGHKVDVRLLMSLADATNPDGHDRVQGELESGVQIRMHPNPPSFFWITDHDTVGLPLTWGEAWPTSVVAIQSPTLAAVLTWVYDRVWAEAISIESLMQMAAGGDSQPWDGMLRLMNQGMTMDAASAALGIAPRTGRRRVADAMAQFGVTSHFSLGAAWQAAQLQGPQA